MLGRGLLIDVTHVANGEIQIEDAEARGEIRRGDLVFSRIDWSSLAPWDRYREPHPKLAVEVIERLASCGVNAVGIDAPGLGQGRRHAERDRLLAENDVLVIENLANLASIPVEEFTVCCLPLKLEDVDAIPARVLAEVEAGR